MSKASLVVALFISLAAVCQAKEAAKQLTPTRPELTLSLKQLFEKGDVISLSGSVFARVKKLAEKVSQMEEALALANEVEIDWPEEVGFPESQAMEIFRKNSIAFCQALADCLKQPLKERKAAGALFKGTQQEIRLDNSEDVISEIIIRLGDMELNPKSVSIKLPDQK